MDQNNSTEEVIKVKLIREWLLSETSFKGHLDEEFILTFLSGCKFNEIKTKSKIQKYYGNRVAAPQWWFNRDPMDDKIKQIADRRPIIGIGKMSRIGEDSSSYNDLLKYMSMLAEVAIRSSSCQKSGIIGAIDMKDVPYWFILQLISPVNVKLFITSFCFALPLRIKGIHFFNANYTVTLFWKIAQTFLPTKIKKRIQVHSSDWSSKLIPAIQTDMLPNELGGKGGSMENLTDVTNENIMKYREYFLNEKHYGFFQTNRDTRTQER
ncbi:hypothetical protein CHUAL_002883 [Chamberlinius hualienensis]